MSATAVAIRSSEVPSDFTAQMHMATVLADSTLLPVHLRGKPANVLVVLQGARALDVSAFWAFQSMHVIDGKLGLSAELMRALVIRAGHTVRVVERSNARAIVEIQRADRDTPYRAEFTWDDAVAAKLTGRDNYTKYRKSMLVARATAIAVRDECPDVMFGVVYTPDELGAVTDEEGVPTVDAQGHPIIDGDVVEPPLDEDLEAWASEISRVDLTQLPTIWAEIVDRGAVLLPVPGTEDTLSELMVNRVLAEAKVAPSRQALRALWELARVCRLGDRIVKVDEEVWVVKDYLVAASRAVPEEPLDSPAGEPDTDTEHAQQLKTAAAASWVGDAEGEGEPVDQ